jgi:hypothetical protein
MILYVYFSFGNKRFENDVQQQNQNQKPKEPPLTITKVDFRSF